MKGGLTMREREDTGRDLLTFIAGAMLGAGLALLYAPKTGKEVREKVSDFTDDAMAKMREFGSETQERVKSSFYKGKNIAEEKAENLASAGKSIKEEMFH